MDSQATPLPAIDRHKAYFRLPFNFDPVRLKAECDAFLPEDWLPHYNPRDYDGEWTVIALIAIAGRNDMIYSNPNSPVPYAPTPNLAKSPYLQEVIGQFKCPLQTVRLMRLAPGSSIKEHNDPGLGWAYGQARIHIPIETDTNVEFYMNGERVSMLPGECWYLNFDLPHRVDNRSAAPRTHLVVDALLNPWLEEVFQNAHD